MATKDRPVWSFGFEDSTGKYDARALSKRQATKRRAAREKDAAEWIARVKARKPKPTTGGCPGPGIKNDDG